MFSFSKLSQSEHWTRTSSTVVTRKNRQFFVWLCVCDVLSILNEKANGEEWERGNRWCFGRMERRQNIICKCSQQYSEAYFFSLSPSLSLLALLSHRLFSEGRRQRCPGSLYCKLLHLRKGEAKKKITTVSVNWPSDYLRIRHKLVSFSFLRTCMSSTTMLTEFSAIRESI